MKNSFFMLLLYSFIFLFGGLEIAIAEPVAILVNKKNPISDLSSADLRKIVRGTRTRWSDLQKIVKITREPTAKVRRDFYRTILNVEPTFTIVHPITKDAYDGIEMPSDKALISLVAATPNAIGYAYSTAITTDVKVLKIDGYLPRDAGYPLQ